MVFENVAAGVEIAAAAADVNFDRTSAVAGGDGSTSVGGGRREGVTGGAGGVCRLLLPLLAGLRRSRRLPHPTLPGPGLSRLAIQLVSLPFQVLLHFRSCYLNLQSGSVGGSLSPRTHRACRTA